MSWRPELKVPDYMLRILDSPALATLFRPVYPPVAVEVSSERLVAVSVERRKGSARLVAQRVVELPAGLVQPVLLRPVLADPEEFSRQLRTVLEGLPQFGGSFSLVLPDRVARVTFVDLEQQAPTVSEMTDLVRWKLKRSTPFRVEDGRLSYQIVGGGRGRGVRCIVCLVQGQVIEQLERSIAELGYQAGLVDLCSHNVWNLLADRFTGSGDTMLLNVSPDQATVLIGRSGAPIFFRTKAPSGAEPISFGELHAEIHPTLLYYRERMLGAGIERVLLRAPKAMAGRLREVLEGEHGLKVEPVALDGVADGASLGAEQVYHLAPALGAALGR